MTGVTFRQAAEDDLAAIVALLADDDFGSERETAAPPLDQGYVDGFAAVSDDPNQLLAVAEMNGEIVGTVQISFVPGVALRGALRGTLEGVRVARHLRGKGVGREMIAWAVEQCRARGCALVQLTTNKQRRGAQDFYRALGFANSHEGFKLTLD